MDVPDPQENRGSGRVTTTNLSAKRDTPELRFTFFFFGVLRACAGASAWELARRAEDRPSLGERLYE